MNHAKEFKGMYISADNKIKVNAMGNENDFKKFLVYSMGSLQATHRGPL